jgi:hypothetical protein
MHHDSLEVEYYNFIFSLPTSNDLRQLQRRGPARFRTGTVYAGTQPDEANSSLGDATLEDMARTYQPMLADLRLGDGFKNLCSHIAVQTKCPCHTHSRYSEHAMTVGVQPEV